MAIHNRNNIHKSSKSGKEALAKGKKMENKNTIVERQQ